jgi:PPOX class probable F420-dependent enzyme
MHIETASPFGRRVVQRLAEERIGWLTTVDSHGRPQPRPVWFYWDGASFLIYTRPDTAKIRHIAANPQVALHLDSDGLGGDIVVFTGRAEIIPGPPLPEVQAAYIEKYRSGFKRINMTPEQFESAYHVVIRIHPQQLRGH